MSAFSLIMRNRNLSGSNIGGIAETQEMLDFCGQHNITADVEVIPIQKINEAYERLLKSDVKYRFSIDMASLSLSRAVRGARKNGNANWHFGFGIDGRQARNNLLPELAYRFVRFAP